MGATDGSDSLGARAPESVRAPSSSLRWMLAAAALVLLLHARVVGFEFLAFDDPWNIVENPRLRPPTLDGLLAYWSGPYLGLYVPLACSMWWLAALAGDPPEAWLYHLLPLLAHAGAAAMLARLLSRLGFGGLAALLGAALWSLHPLQVEVVAWASELRGAAANLLAFAYIERWFAARAEARRAPLVHAHLALVGALLCKPSAAVAPALVVLLELGLAEPGAASRRSRLARHLPAFVLCAAALFASKLAQSDELLRSTPSPLGRALVACDALGHQARCMLLPTGLSPDHGRRPEEVLAAGFGAFAPWFGAALCAGACFALARLARRRAAHGGEDGRALAAALLVVPCALAPTLGLVPFAHQAISTTADRYASLALLGPALALALACRRFGAPATVAGGALVALLATASAIQAASWRDTRALFERTIALNPSSALAATNLGLAAERQGNLTEARGWYERALRARPGHARAHQNLGLLLAREGELEAARAHLLAARDAQPWFARHHSNLAAILARAGDERGALASAARSVELDPGLADGHNALGVLAQRRGDHAEALARFERAAALRREEAEYQRNVALELALVGRVEEARAAWGRALLLPGAKASFRLEAARLELAPPRRAERAREFVAPLLASGGPLLGSALEVDAQALE
ncbi:MAG: repeat-containing protein YrrB, partial [Planctomycetota bacterium]